MTIYERIRMLRELKGMSQAKLAEKCGYEGKSMISRIESGQIDLQLSKFVLIAKALDVDPIYLMGFDDEQGNEDDALLLDDLIRKARSLDSEDKARIAERIEMLLENHKYGGES